MSSANQEEQPGHTRGAERVTGARKPNDSGAGPDRSPRFGIRHLMVWAACIAVYSAWTRFLFGDLSANGAGIHLGLTALYFVIHGAALAGPVLAASRLDRRIPFPAHPGDWLFLLTGLGTVLGMGHYLWAVAQSDSEIWMQILQASLRVVLALGQLLVGVAWIWAAVRMKADRWRVFFWSTILVHVLQVPVVAWMDISMVASRISILVGLLIPAGMLVAVVLLDRSRGQRYPWTHWAGVAVYLSLRVLSIIGMIARAAFG